MTKKIELTKVSALEVSTKIVELFASVATSEQMKQVEAITQEFNATLSDLVDKLETMKESEVKASKRKRGSSKVSKEKTENMEKVRQGFLDKGDNEPLTLVEIGVLINMSDATPQKLSAIMKPLVDSGEFEKVKKDKKVAYQVAMTQI